MNANMKIVRDWIITQSYETAIIELEGEYDTVPNEVYKAYYCLSYIEKLKVFRNAVNHIIKNY
ncbi:hypothetical protein FJQ98_16465 [Lysinibacillus agricola]|uniref:HEPN domain-containing protein n=1 Tax=Lysinibacillus agricola TaxID=2590012 RepID=A0ABX7ALX2_9BACI|nr:MULTISPECIES: hypothetical protein [Lysinibacillus]KOS61476.1 hypothetical protein AN161_17955 [Lysinibacillus sp. FJAT-14222]QQP10839.1 hypothetical protein FJQ98_16465 [Lysinibacillus agricola]